MRRIPGGGGGLVEVHRLGVGDTVEISVPRNAFMMPLPGSASRSERLRFLAGGIGITPILPMARLAERLGVPWSLLLHGPSPGQPAVFGRAAHVRRQGTGTHRRRARPADRCRAAGWGGRANGGVRVWPATDDRGCSPGRPALFRARSCTSSGSPRCRSSTGCRLSWSWREVGRWWGSAGTRAPWPRCGRPGPTWATPASKVFAAPVSSGCSPARWSIATTPSPTGNGSSGRCWSACPGRNPKADGWSWTSRVGPLEPVGAVGRPVQVQQFGSRTEHSARRASRRGRWYTFIPRRTDSTSPARRSWSSADDG